MINKLQFLAATLFLVSINLSAQTDAELGLKTGLVYNQIGYGLENQKIILLLDDNPLTTTHAFTLTDASSNIVLSGNANFEVDEWRRRTYSIDLTAITTEGVYTLAAGSHTASIKISSNYIRDINVNEYFEELFDHQRTPALEVLPILDRISTDVTASSGADFTNSGNFLEKRGGWKDAHSNDQHVSHAKIVTALLTAYEENPSLFDSDQIDGKTKVLNEAIWGLDFLMSIQSPTGFFYGRLNGEQYTPQQPIRSIISDSASFYNLLGASALAQGYTVLNSVDPVFAQECLDAAIMGWDWYEANPEIHNNAHSYWTARYDAKLLAAYELWRATGDSKYKTILDNGILTGELRSPVGRGWEAFWHSNAGPSAIYDFDNWFGFENFLTNSNILMLYGKYYEDAPLNVQTEISNQANFLKSWLSSRTSSAYNFYDIYFVPYFGMSGDIAITSTMLCYFGDAIGDDEIFNMGLDNFDFTLGKNPLGESFVAEVGTNLHNNLWKPNTMDVKGSVVSGVIKFNSLPTANATVIGDVNAQGWQVDEVLMSASSLFFFNYAILDKREQDIITDVKSIDNNVEHSFKIFPNPSSEFINIEEGYTQLQIIDVQGKIVKTAKNSQNKINISDLSDGVYFIKLTAKNKDEIQRIIKK